MKLYHYVPKENTVKEKGLLSFSKSKDINLKSYTWRAEGLKTKKDVCQWMEKSFVGRSRGIRFFTEPVKWYKHSVRVLKGFVDSYTLVSVDVNQLVADGLIESVYVSPPIQKTHPEIMKDPKLMKCDEFYYKLKSIKDIDYSPIDWTICDDESGRRFACIPYYLLVMKDGKIPPKYITFENTNTKKKEKTIKKVITLKDGRTLLARKISGTDYDDVMDFLDKFSRGKGAHWTNQYPGQPKRNKEACVKLYDSPDALFIGVWDGKKLIGFGSLILGRRNHPRNALAGDFGIMFLENYTSCGLGTFIMKELDKWAKKEKVHRIQGMVFHENIRALGLYQKLGFEIEGMAREIAKYNNKWQHGYYIAKILD